MPPTLRLLIPLYRSFRNHLGHQGWGGYIKLGGLVLLVGMFWWGVFFIVARVLTYFQGVELLGDLLAQRLLSMVFLTFFSVLIFSNIVTALPTFFLAQELPLWIAAPLPLERFYLARLAETLLHSSWMVLIFALPIFLAYGVVYHSPLPYYLRLVMVIPPFLVLPAGLGTLVTIALVALFPARKIRHILLWLSLLFVVSAYVMVRLLQPEKLVNPDAFATLLQYLSGLRASSSPLLPSHWATEAVYAALPGRAGLAGGAGWPTLLLVSTALAMVAGGIHVAAILYVRGYSKAQEASGEGGVGRSPIDRLLAPVRQSLSAPVAAIITKDVKTFFRDTTQWSQLLLLLALVVVYLYNYSVLPLDQFPYASFFLQNLIGFLNMALAGFVIAAVAVRFVYPATSQEGRAMWIITSSPLPVGKFLWCKFWTSLLPLLLLGELLVILSNYLLHVTPFLMTLSSLTMFFMVFGITGLGIGLGAATHPRGEGQHPSQIATGLGGVTYMIICMLYIGLVVVIEAWPVHLLFSAQLGQRLLSHWHWLGITLAFLEVAALTLLAVWLPMRLGLRRLEALER